MTRSSQLSMLLIAFSILMLACNSSTPKNNTSSSHDSTALGKECIKKVIALDDSLGTVRNHACETISLSETIQKYVQGMEAINYNNCPEAFSTAFKKHREAWTAMLSITDQYPDLRGEMHDLFDGIEKGKDAAIFKPLLKAIWDTWAEVENAMKE